ncbi:hypothetical protein NC653_017137 [Populus alba x Populus x berolinensis]|uniref:Uncharacterized protein n=1 Tax=Populus alba x Populus x berolinensis TaxID=444605 RepID=A0AAD6W045_9ROSI|nr:hypothetical protein NC653_017137 [Populus alba x Populus x berolinensis]
MGVPVALPSRRSPSDSPLSFLFSFLALQLAQTNHCRVVLDIERNALSLVPLAG